MVAVMRLLDRLSWDRLTLLSQRLLLTLFGSLSVLGRDKTPTLLLLQLAVVAIKQPNQLEQGCALLAAALAEGLQAAMWSWG